jgi:hypothetical protein
MLGTTAGGMNYAGHALALTLAEAWLGMLQQTERRVEPPAQHMADWTNGIADLQVQKRVRETIHNLKQGVATPPGHKFEALVQFLRRHCRPKFLPEAVSIDSHLPTTSQTRNWERRTHDNIVMQPMAGGEATDWPRRALGIEHRRRQNWSQPRRPHVQDVIVPNMIMAQAIDIEVNQVPCARVRVQSELLLRAIQNQNEGGRLDEQQARQGQAAPQPQALFPFPVPQRTARVHLWTTRTAASQQKSGLPPSALRANLGSTGSTCPPTHRSRRNRKTRCRHR